MYPFINMFGKTIPTYSIFLYLGVAIGIIIAVLRSKRYQIQMEESFYFCLIAVVGALVGAKLLYLIVELPRFIKYPELLKLAVKAGFIFYGGFIGGIIAAVIYAHVYKLDLRVFADLSAPSIAIGHSLGRIGCFMAGCCYGAPTNSVVGVIFKDSPLAPHDIHVHPVQLYESAGNLLIFIILMLYSRCSPKKGKVFGLYLVLYSILRFILELFRGDYRGTVGFLSTSQFISVLILIWGCLLLLSSLHFLRLSRFISRK